MNEATHLDESIQKVCINCHKPFYTHNDDAIDIENQSERQIMESHGYARVFDSGVIRWEYVPDR